MDRPVHQANGPAWMQKCIRTTTWQLHSICMVSVMHTCAARCGAACRATCSAQSINVAFAAGRTRHWPADGPMQHQRTTHLLAIVAMLLQGCQVHKSAVPSDA